MKELEYLPLWGRNKWVWIVAGLLLFSVGFLSTITSPYISNDESWFLQVLNRLKNGAVLYRDVFSGVTPFSFYLTLLPINILATELLVLKAMMALIFALIGLACLWVGHQLRLGKFFVTTLILILVVYCPPYIMGTSAPYTPLSYLFLITCLGAALQYQANQVAKDNAHYSRNAWLALAAVSAGLSFASKQTTGFYTIAALLVTLLIIHGGRVGRRLFWLESLFVGFVFMLVLVVTVLLPVFLSRGLQQFVDYAFINKGTYLRVAPISYQYQLATLIELTCQVLTGEHLEELYIQVQYLFPLIVVLLGVLGFVQRGAARKPLVVLGIFSAAAMGDVFPRVTVHHLSCAIPVLWVAGAYSLQKVNLRWDSPLMRSVRYLVLIWLLIGLGFRLWKPVERVIKGGERLSTLPHMRGVVYPPPQAREQLYATTRLKELVTGEPVFILSAQAGFLYLISDLENPTPYDYGLVTAFGLGGEQQIIQAVKNGNIPYVCIAPFGEYYLRPVTLQNFVESQMLPIEDLGICTLFRAP